MDPMTGQPQIDPNTGQPATQEVKQNDIELIGKLYDVRAAGDVDVVQRQEKIQQMMQLLVAEKLKTLPGKEILTF